jgi:CubicO group peptidase (beta-lactamase class C family)
VNLRRRRDVTTIDVFAPVRVGLWIAVALQAPPDDLVKEIEEIHAKARVPALSVAVIDEGRLRWAYAFGEGATIGTRFQAASISKPVAAFAALRLVEAGKLKLDEEVNATLKTWKVPENEHTAKRTVTLRGLLSHSAGLTVHGFRGYADGERVPTLEEVLDGRKPANSAPIRVSQPPGERFRYSGGGFCVLQLLMVDAGGGKPFPDVMRELAFGPLGMSASGYDAAPEMAAAGHLSNGREVPGKFHVYPEMAAAGLWTTPSDLARFAVEILRALRGESKLLSKETAEEMLKVQAAPMGLGVMLAGEGRGRRFHHGGSNVGFKCMLVAFPETGQGAVVMTNADHGATLIEPVLRAIGRAHSWPEAR